MYIQIVASQRSLKLTMARKRTREDMHFDIITNRPPPANDYNIAGDLIWSANNRSDGNNSIVMWNWIVYIAKKVTVFYVICGFCTYDCLKVQPHSRAAVGSP
eukprot:441752_1